MIVFPIFSPVNLLFVIYSFYKLGKNISHVFYIWLYERSKKFKKINTSGLSIDFILLCEIFSFCNIIRFYNPLRVEI